MPPDAPAASDESVVCRPSAEWWVMTGLAAISALMGGSGALLPSNTPPPSPLIQTAFFGIFSFASLLTAAWLTWWTLNARIVADAGGLRWRTGFSWKSARWEEVQDYYDLFPVRAGRDSSQGVIKTRAGSVSFGGQWTQMEPLRVLVTRQATNAAVSRWDMLGTRPCDAWPRVFRYDTWQNVWTPRILLKLLLTGFGYVFAKPLQQAAGLAGLVGWPMKLALFAPYLFILFLYAGPLLMVFAQYRAAGRRKAQRITADTDGIVFEDGARRLEAAWSEVTGYEIARGPGALTVRYVVETRQGGFDFLASLSGALLLKAIIQRYSVGTADKEWRARVDPEVLGGEATRWSGRCVGVGARVYHYRTRMNRALLGLPLGSCLSSVFVAWLAWQGLMPGTQAAGPGCGAFGFGLLFLACWHTYRVCRIEADADGLTQITPLGRRRLQWNQIEDYWLTAEGGGTVHGRGERFGFSSGIVGRDELKAEITRRAVICGGKAWERRPTTTGPDARRRGRQARGSSARG